MPFFRRWLLILLVLLAGGGPAWAASREDRAYAAAVLAFQDKFYSLAQTRLTQFLQNYHKSTNAPMAVLLLAQSDYYLKNYPAVTNRLLDGVNLTQARAASLDDRYLYWCAEAQFAQGDLADAAKTFETVVNNYPASSLALGAAVEAAAVYAQQSSWAQVDALLENPGSLFQRIARDRPTDELVVNGRLLQAESKCAQGEFPAALQALDLIHPATLLPEQKWKRAYLAYRANLGRNDLESALAATTNLLQVVGSSGAVWATNRATSVVCHADVLERQGRLPEAEAALHENLTNLDVPVDLQQTTILKLAELALKANKSSDAEAALDAFWLQFPDSPAAATALVSLGELRLKDYLAAPATNLLSLAHTNFLAAPTNGPLAGRVFLNRGWCNWLAAQAAAREGDTNSIVPDLSSSLADFWAAVQHLPVSADMAVARFKMGDAQFALGDFVGAQTNYHAVLTDFASLPDVTNQLASQALYQILRVRLALTNAPGVEESMRDFLHRYAAGAPVESALLLAGQGLSDLNYPEKARAVFAAFERERTNSPLLPCVAFADVRTFVQETNWPQTVAHSEAWLQAYPTNELRPQVEYLRNWAVAQEGDEPRAFNLFTNYISRFPADTNTPLALWWVADHYFRMGTNFTRAEYYYQQIFQDFPTNDLAGRAQLMAGRAAMGRFGYSDAIRSYFTPLMSDTNAPDDLRDRARFAYCEALRLMPASDTNSTIYGYLQQATNILSQMYPEASTNIVGVLAWCETGDCDLQLGAYDAATNAYALVFNSPLVARHNALRGRAQVGFGKALEKKAEQFPEDVRKALLDQAMDAYADVFASPGDSQDPFWRKEAALLILRLNARTGTLKNVELDHFIAELKATFPQLQDSPEFKRLTPRN